MHIKRPAQASTKTYLDAVVFVALNDAPDEVDINEVERHVSTSILAELYSRQEVEVAQDLITVRLRELEADAAKKRRRL